MKAKIIVGIEKGQIDLELLGRKIDTILQKSKIEPNAISRFSYRSENASIALLAIQGSESYTDTPSIIRALSEPKGTPDIEWRLYESLQPNPPSLPQTLSRPHILVLNSMTRTPESEVDFNSWYEEEHIPLLCKGPSWLLSQRYILLFASYAAPQYMAMHAWEGHQAFLSKEYGAAVQTTWRSRVMANIVDRERLLMEFVEAPNDHAVTSA